MAEGNVLGPTSFDLLRVGVAGEAQLIHVAASDKSQDTVLPRNTLPAGLPPVLPQVEDDLEELLGCVDTLAIHNHEHAQRFWPRDPNVDSLYEMDVCPVQTTIMVDRNLTTGELLGYKEEYVQDIGNTAKNSMSLNRAPGPPDQSLRGNSTNYPFWPGGLDEPNLDELHTSGETTDIDFENDLLEIPPSMNKGMSFEKKSVKKMIQAETKKMSALHLADIFTTTDEIDLGEGETDQEEGEKDEALETVDNMAAAENIDNLVQTEPREVVKISTAEAVKEEAKEEWAVQLDIKTPVDDFHKRVPNMAYKWPFELDTFQKQAVLHLEKHDNVFVAAHTSAGKTVVAEYAIALSMNHMTRTIYTSPIKALSNQKFRDFKVTFGDVGLITGDVQIKSEAACLIMTTEILRSMLYNGSDVIRDLEWVIFDEVHYINDAERGVVWEEVLIMLPQHVNIILLSATVPNTMEFADWVGRTKRRKVYVVSTQKRPVPLEHYLYTGNSNKTSNELFMIVDSNKQFLQSGYYKAVDAKKERASKVSQSFGAKGTRGGNPHQDKNVWLSIIDMLRKKDTLPVVAFTFSKKKIDENAFNLNSVDLTTASEKSEIHIFFQKCISRLKGTDRQLPQVKRMQEMLKRGIGIHHSGVLPILKEVVEMLFQRSLVKVLFATETFAMGVNMPARTVVFDSIRKHDGTNFRDLLPGEYIQMAGRAGRRGLDTTGTVIILCKGDVPEMADLHKMMLGKPTLLQSQFRLTYTMILNLLRVEQLRVEDMMKRSFSEFHNQKDVSKRKEMLQVLQQQITDLPEVVDYSGDLEEYYHTCDQYFKLKTYLQKVTLSHPQASKCLMPGRIVIVDTEKNVNMLGVILHAGPASSKERTFSALMLCEQKTDNKTEVEKHQPSNFLLPRPVTAYELYHPEGPCGHEIIQLKADNISVITTKTLKINAERIIDDVKKRQIPRFRNDPPGQSTSVACQELLRLVEGNPTGLPGLDAVKDLHIRDIELVEEFQKLHGLEKVLPTFKCIHDPSFLDNFEKLRVHMKMKEEYKHIKFLLSDESLQLLDEYKERIQVLRQLQYIDGTNTVQLKGRVACEISNHELIITELVFENVLTSLHPTEIAALLSCVVFEQKRCSEPNLCDTLEEAKKRFLSVAQRIGELQKECGLLMPVGDYVDQFHFGLMEVVYEWARGMPFSQIIELTDIQEGIIVRCIQRLDETIRDVRNAARLIGDPVLYQKMEEASRNIKRDIVFAASLYTQNQ